MRLNEHAHSTALPVNKCRDRALKMRLKAQLSGSFPHWTSGKNFDPGSRFECPAGLVCSRRDPGPSSDHIEQQTAEGFGRSPDRFGAYADS